MEMQYHGYGFYNFPVYYEWLQFQLQSVHDNKWMLKMTHDQRDQTKPRKCSDKVLCWILYDN